MRAAESGNGTVDISILGKASPTKGELTLSFEFSGQENPFSRMTAPTSSIWERP